jgi:ElaB/YqjD/DUF883 family membrane-anchored ribosome-binding protein
METTFENSDSLRNSKRSKSEAGDMAHSVTSAAANELKNFVADVEDALKRMTNVNNVDIARVRAKLQAVIDSAKDNVTTGTAAFKRQAQHAALQTDEFVHDSPWQAIGISAALAAVIGASIGYFAARR